MKDKDPIKKKQRWVTGAWRAHPRYLTIDKVDSDEIFYTFDDGQATSANRTVFLRTFVRAEPVAVNKKIRNEAAL